MIWLTVIVTVLLFVYLLVALLRVPSGSNPVGPCPRTTCSKSPRSSESYNAALPQAPRARTCVEGSPSYAVPSGICTTASSAGRCSGSQKTSRMTHPHRIMWIVSHLASPSVATIGRPLGRLRWAGLPSAWISDGRYTLPPGLSELVIERCWQLDTGPQTWKQYCAAMLLFNGAHVRLRLRRAGVPSAAAEAAAQPGR